MEVIYTTKKRKYDYLLHIVRNEKYKWLQQIIQTENKVQGKEYRGLKTIERIKFYLFIEANVILDV